MQKLATWITYLNHHCLAHWWAQVSERNFCPVWEWLSLFDCSCCCCRYTAESFTWASKEVMAMHLYILKFLLISALIWTDQKGTYIARHINIHFPEVYRQATGSENAVCWGAKEGKGRYLCLERWSCQYTQSGSRDVRDLVMWPVKLY